MIVLNNKVYFELLDDSKQPKKTIFTPNAEMLKHAKVISVGSKVEEIKEEDIITLYVNHINMIDEKEGLCSDRDPVFINYYPRKDKINASLEEKSSLTPFTKAKVISSSCNDIKDGDTVYIKSGQGHILPDNTELISESQIYYKG